MDRTLPWFRTAEDRDRRYAEWVEATGATMRDGLMCVVDDGTRGGCLMEFCDGKWGPPRLWRIHP